MGSWQGSHRTIGVLAQYDLLGSQSSTTAATLLLLNLCCLQGMLDYQKQQQNESDSHSHHVKVTHMGV